MAFVPAGVAVGNDEQNDSAQPESPYQDRILRHSREPSHMGPQPGTLSHTQTNPLCGDEVTIFFGGTPTAVLPTFEAKGCALCRASASILMQEVRGVSASEAALKIQLFISTFENPGFVAAPNTDMAALGDMRRFPSRTKCVLLPWEALRALFAASSSVN